MTYPGDLPVHALSAVTLDVRRRDHLTVVGPSGSGKSSFMNIVGLLDRPTSGSYEFDGKDVTLLSERERTALRGTQIGFVFQAFHLLPHRTAIDNVALAQLYTGLSRRTRHERAREVLATVGLSHRAEALPTQLSGGERQRVAIGRALANNPNIVLADEPTGNLDSKNAEIVLELFRSLNDIGHTIIVITHDSHVASSGNRVVTILDGVLSEDATKVTLKNAD